MGNFKDLTGKKFGRLTVIEKDIERSKNGVIFWICECECGNRKSVRGGSLKNGTTLSCGCLNKEINSKQKDLSYMIGQRFGRLVVVKRAGTHVCPSGQKKPLWLCKCDCGNMITVISEDLKTGHTKSCGCLPTKKRGSGLLDLTGKRFGKLVAIERAEDYCYESKGKIITAPRWLCKCDCGNMVIVQGGNLRSGNTTSCGCENKASKSELIISEFLNNNGIKYCREYSFDDLRNQSGNLLRFDFAIFNDNEEIVVLVEYQGSQHYLDCGEFGLYQRKYSDKMKREYCDMNNLFLCEIRYDENLEEALGNLLVIIQQKLNN